ncbi:30S ribosomal protein S9 [Candidatus Woesearchaeota archaeon]|nr:30S ribosomal protein S9 [Candidatus Woesearchaeota archaeon]
MSSVKVFNTSGKRKKATAKATIKAGSGVVKVNDRLANCYEPRLARLKLMEPLSIAGSHASGVDIRVRVRGGGTFSQAEAARLAIARALVAFTKDKKLEKDFLDYDRHMLVADVRQREPRKPNTAGKARSKTQKSYR